MKDIYLTNYSVKGIKSLEDMVSLSFYKKIISKNPDTQEYNIKGIYGMNGSGKTGIITSVDILRNLINVSDYLNNPIVQKNLDELINKRTRKFFVETEYLADFNKTFLLFKYCIELSKDNVGRYVISHEKLSYRKATSKDETLQTVFEVIKGKVVDISGTVEDEFNKILIESTLNLLATSSMVALFYEKILIESVKNNKIFSDCSFVSLCTLLVFGGRLHVYLDKEDDHGNYFIRKSFGMIDDLFKHKSQVDEILECFGQMTNNSLNIVYIDGNYVPKSQYDKFKENVKRLHQFIRIFKSDLKEIQIDKKEDKDAYICNLIMVYDLYKIDAEFESTGIKKLIKLFAYINEMAQGGIVFIDEFDSNLHDVYLCALLEYLMEYGEGQLCFTTHNVGPMDVLRRNKKSIDFLSEDNKIYPWKTNGNYSPSKLYRNGMIEGSPFNVDSIDFIGVFKSSGGE